MPNRPDYSAGHYYHLYNRGAHRAAIFREDENYLFVLRRMKEASRETGLVIIAYCLLPNHYHYLIRQDSDTPAGSLPQQVYNSYSKAFNKRYAHSGTLFEGPYRVRPVTTQPYLLHLCAYIHANPVRHGLVNSPEAWPYSNYLEWLGKRNGTMVDHGFVRDCFGGPDPYQQYVRDYLDRREILEEMAMWLSRWDRE